MLPAVSLGLWHNFGGDTPHETKRAICRTAFDVGITHFDLANNYGPPPGSAETAFGEILADRLRRPPRRADHLDQGRLPDVARPLRRVGQPQVPARLARPEPRSGWASTTSTSSTPTASTPTTPLEETMGALDTAVRSGRALYAGLSSYNSEKTREAAAILKDLGTPCVIHQPSYNMINRWVERDGLKDDAEGARHRLDRLHPARPGHADRASTSRASPRAAAPPRASRSGREFLNDRAIANIRKLNEIAERPRPDPRPDGDRLGAARRRHHLGADRRLAPLPGRGLRRRGEEPRLHRAPSSPRSTATPTRRTSTSGQDPRRQGDRAPLPREIFRVRK